MRSRILKLKNKITKFKNIVRTTYYQLIIELHGNQKKKILNFENHPNSKQIKIILQPIIYENIMKIEEKNFEV